MVSIHGSFYATHSSFRDNFGTCLALLRFSVTTSLTNTTIQKYTKYTSGISPHYCTLHYQEEMHHTSKILHAHEEPRGACSSFGELRLAAARSNGGPVWCAACSRPRAPRLLSAVLSCNTYETLWRKESMLFCGKSLTCRSLLLNCTERAAFVTLSYGRVSTSFQTHICVNR